MNKYQNILIEEGGIRYMAINDNCVEVRECSGGFTGDDIVVDSEGRTWISNHGFREYATGISHAIQVGKVLFIYERGLI
jgi:hypothetical protein